MSKDVPEREYFERLIAELDRRYEQRFRAQEKAIDKAEAAVERRLEGQNEWRAQSAQRERQFLPRIEYETAHASLVERFNALDKRMDKNDGTKVGASMTWALVAAAFGTLIGIAGIVVAIVR